MPVLFLALAPATVLQAAVPRTDVPTSEEQKALDQLAAEIEGRIVYTRYVGKAMDPKHQGYTDWVVEKMTIGEWKPVQLGEGRFACWSPDGKQIAVFVLDPPAEPSPKGDPTWGKVYVMNADGSGRRLVVDGAASKVTGRPMYWHPNGQEIVYMRGVKTADPTRATTSLYAANVKTGETRDLLPGMKNSRGQGANYFTSEPQMSADGKFLAARASDPSGRKHGPVLVDMEKQAVVLRAQGTCCAALSPDGCWLTSNTGGHDQLIIEHRDGAQKIIMSTKTAMTTADRAALLGPRGRKDSDWDNPTWSNHADYLAAKADNGSLAVYVFRVSEKRWTRVYFGGGHCDYPDLFVTKDTLTDRKPLSGDDLAGAAPAGGPTAKGAPAKGAVAAWPGDRTGLEFVWTDRSKANVIAVPGGKPRMCEVQMRGKARFDHFYAMDLVDGMFVAENAADALLAACRKSGELTLEAMVIPERGDYKEPAGIVSFSLDSKRVNYELGQLGDTLVLRLNTSGKGAAAPVPLCKLSVGKTSHVVVTYAAGKTSCYVDGKLELSSGAITGDFRSWAPQHLVFGANFSGAPPWTGRLEGIAIRSRAVPAAEAATAYDLAMQRVKPRQPVKGLVVEGKLTATSAVPNLETLEYRRCLLVYQYEVTKVLEGACAEKKILVAHWGVLDNVLIPGIVDRKVGSTHVLRLESFGDNPQISSEKQALDVDDPTLPLYYDVAK